MFISPLPPHPALHSFPTRRSSDLAMSVLLYRRRQNLLQLLPFVGGAIAALAVVALVVSLVYAPTEYRSLKLRSEEHTSELQSRGHLVCRLLLEKKKAI